MKVIVFFILVFAVCGTGFSQNNRECEAATAKDFTHWGHIANEIKEQKPLKILYGVVKASNDEPIYSALVEVFSDNGKSQTPTTPSSQRIAACVTQIDGRFRFNKLKAGKYILAIGREGFNITFIKLTLEPRNRRSSNKRLSVRLEIGT